MATRSHRRGSYSPANKSQFVSSASHVLYERCLPRVPTGHAHSAALRRPLWPSLQPVSLWKTWPPWAPALPHSDKTRGEARLNAKTHYHARARGEGDAAEHWLGLNCTSETARDRGVCVLLVCERTGWFSLHVRQEFSKMTLNEKFTTFTVLKTQGHHNWIVAFKL